MRSDSHFGVEEGEVIERQLPCQPNTGLDIHNSQLDSEAHINGSRLQRKRRFSHEAESNSHKKHSLEHTNAKPSMVNSEHVQVAGCEDTADLDIALPFERNEELEAKRLLEERRRRRQLIMQKHATQSNSLDTFIDVRPSSNSMGTGQVAHAEPSLEDGQFALEKTGTNSTPAANGAGVSAADYNPNYDSHADDTRHRAAAKAVEAATKATPSKSDEDDFDMFADDDEIPIIGTGNVGGAAPGAAVSAVASMM
ncbi:hypothetical protein IWW36_003734, partial [Coemansia brasiliensis]